MTLKISEYYIKIGPLCNKLVAVQDFHHLTPTSLLSRWYVHDRAANQCDDIATFKLRPSNLRAMSELQSNAAFHLSQNPLKCVNHIVLPPYLIYGIAARTFWCIVHGSSRPFEITVHSNHNIDDVKKDIISQEIILRHITHSSLVLWKVSFYSWDLYFRRVYLAS